MQQQKQQNFDEVWGKVLDADDWSNQIKMIKEIVDQKVDLDMVDENEQYTILMYMIECGNDKAVKLLVKQGADVNFLNPLELAVEAEDWESVRKLIKAGANLVCDEEFVLAGVLEDFEFYLNLLDQQLPERVAKFKARYYGEGYWRLNLALQRSNEIRSIVWGDYGDMDINIQFTDDSVLKISFDEGNCSYHAYQDIIDHFSEMKQLQHLEYECSISIKRDSTFEKFMLDWVPTIILPSTSGISDDFLDKIYIKADCGETIVRPRDCHICESCEEYFTGDEDVCEECL